MLSYAVLIDGGFVKRKLGSQKQPMTAEMLRAFVEKLASVAELSGMRLHRIYYYDAHPLTDTFVKPLNGGKVNFAETDAARRNRKLFSALARLPFFALRMGELSFRGWNVGARAYKDNGKNDRVEITAEALDPVIQQKGVDMRIGLDIASLTLKKQAQVIVLVTGDSDFIPAMKFARKEGAQLYLVPLGHSIKEPMYEHADLTIDLPSL